MRRAILTIKISILNAYFYSGYYLNVLSLFFGYKSGYNSFFGYKIGYKMAMDTILDTKSKKDTNLDTFKKYLIFLIQEVRT